MNWNDIKRFNFTWAILGGAWLEDGSGNRNWCSFTQIAKYLGEIWLQMKAQGWMTGCWINVVN